MCKDKKSCVFDVPIDKVKLIEENWKGDKNVTLEPIKELPELCEGVSSNINGEGSGRDNNRGGFNNRNNNRNNNYNQRNNFDDNRNNNFNNNRNNNFNNNRNDNFSNNSNNNYSNQNSGRGGKRPFSDLMSIVTKKQKK